MALRNQVDVDLQILWPKEMETSIKWPNWMESEDFCKKKKNELGNVYVTWIQKYGFQDQRDLQLKVLKPIT